MARLQGEGAHRLGPCWRTGEAGDRLRKGFHLRWAAEMILRKELIPLSEAPRAR
jgi:hypothetical protein